MKRLSGRLRDMKAIKPSVEFLEAPDGEKILRKIEKIARTCYKSEFAITDESSDRKSVV